MVLWWGKSKEEKAAEKEEADRAFGAAFKNSAKAEEAGSVQDASSLQDTAIVQGTAPIESTPEVSKAPKEALPPAPKPEPAVSQDVQAEEAKPRSAKPITTDTVDEEVAKEQAKPPKTPVPSAPAVKAEAPPPKEKDQTQPKAPPPLKTPKPPSLPAEAKPDSKEAVIESPRNDAPETPADKPSDSPPAASKQISEIDVALPQKEEEKKGFFSKIGEGLKRSSGKLADGITGTFTKRKLDDETIEELEDLLIASDLGANVAMRVTQSLAKSRYDKEIGESEIKEALAEEITSIMKKREKLVDFSEGPSPRIVLFVGVNGSGKTTTIGKISDKLTALGAKTLLVAGDTFRAAAIEQLTVWGQRSGTDVLAKETGSDAAALVYESIEKAKADGHDIVLIDTAGRLQNRTELMDELAKIVRVARKLDPEAPHDVILVLDATVGQNALSQVDAFYHTAGVTGLVMTKLDGTAKGGVLVAIADKYDIPIHFIGIGESAEDLAPFSAEAYAKALVGIEA